MKIFDARKTVLFRVDMLSVSGSPIRIFVLLQM